MEQKQSIGDLLAFVRRNLIVLITVASLGAGLSVAFALSRPSIFETSAKVLIESPQIPDELARSTASMPTAGRLQMIEQRLMARDSLTALIERLDLFADLKALSPARKAQLLRDSTRIESISASAVPWGQDVGVVAFTISVSLGDAEQAALAANELARGAIAQNLEVRTARAQETLAYFEGEERRIAEALTAAEAAVSDFRKANDGSLPEDLEANRDALARLETSAGEIERQILELELRRAELQGGTLGGGGVGPSGLSTGESELQRLELELATRSRILAPNHPELLRLQEQVDAVRDLVAAGGSPKDESEAGEAAALTQRSASRQQQLDQLTARLEQMTTRQDELARQRARLDAALVRNPEAEASLHALERQLEQLHEQYADVSRRQVEARTGAQLEANRQSERFEILEPALVPEYPVGPNRKKIVVFGAAASGGLAVGLVLLLQMLRPSISTSSQMERELELRPIVAIPYVTAPGERRRRIVRWAGALLLVALAFWGAAFLIDPDAASISWLRRQVHVHLNVGPVLGFIEMQGEPETTN